MRSVHNLIRAAAVCVAALSIAVGAAGWMLVDLGRSVTPWLSPATFQTLDDTLAVTLETTATVREAMVDLDRLAESVADSSATTAAFVEDTAQITTDRVAVSLAAIERSMPGLIDAAAVIDDTLTTLSLFGVDYHPEVPFDRALAEIESNLEGLSVDVAEQGRTLATLVPEIERIGATAESLGGHIVETRLRLREAGAVLGEYRTLVAETPIVSPSPSFPPAAIRLAALAFAALGITLAALMWRIGPELADRGMNPAPNG